MVIIFSRKNILYMASVMNKSQPWCLKGIVVSTNRKVHIPQDCTSKCLRNTVHFVKKHRLIIINKNCRAQCVITDITLMQYRPTCSWMVTIWVSTRPDVWMTFITAAMDAICSTTVPVGMQLHWSTDSRPVWVGWDGMASVVDGRRSVASELK